MILESRLSAKSCDEGIINAVCRPVWLAVDLIWSDALHVTRRRASDAVFINQSTTGE